MLKQLKSLLLENRINPMTGFYTKKYIGATSAIERQLMLYVNELMALYTYQEDKDIENR